MTTIQTEEEKLAAEREQEVVATNWTTTEFALLRALSMQVQGTTLDQIARALFLRQQSPLKRAEQALERLAAAQLIESRVVETHPLESFAKPLFVWKPGDPHPTDHRLKKLSLRARSRWHLSPVAQTIYVATRYAARCFGAFLDSRRVRACEATHNIHLAEVFVYYSVRRPRLAAMWLGEGAFPKLGFDIKGMKDPDAYLINHTGTAEQIIEFAGSYSADHLANFHSHCAGRGASRLAQFCRDHRDFRLAKLYAPQGTRYELW